MTIQPKPRDAQPNDLKVCVVVDRNNFKTPAKPRRAGIVAYAMNTSDVPISVDFSQLTGPILGSVGPKEGVPLELRSDATNMSAVILERDQMIARIFIMDDLSSDDALSAYYTIYRPGHQGEVDQILAIVFSDGRISRLKAPGR
jgi:hypothetical protein